MNNNQTLPTTTGSGTQATTDTPQSVAQSSSSIGSTETNSTVQPSLTSSILENQTGGIPLTSTPITAYDLNAAYPGTTTETTQTASRQPNHALLGVSILLLVVAVVLFWSTSKKSKNTTE